MLDNVRNAIACRKHKGQTTSILFVRYGGSIKQRFHNHEEAGRILNELRFKSDEGSFDQRSYQPDCPLSFTIPPYEHLEYRQADLEPGSFKVLKPRMRRARELFKHTSLKQINHAALDDFIHARTDLASKSSHELPSALHCFFQRMVNRNEIDASQTPKFPKIKVVMKLRKTVDKATRIATSEEVKRITPKSPKIYPGCLWLATYINLRPSELLGILEEDIDRKRGIIRIRDHKTESTNDARNVTLLQEDMDLLKRHPQSFSNLHFFRLNKDNGAAKPGDRFGKSLLYDVWTRACKNLGVEGVPL